MSRSFNEWSPILYSAGNQITLNVSSNDVVYIAWLANEAARATESTKGGDVVSIHR